MNSFEKLASVLTDLKNVNEAINTALGYARPRGLNVKRMLRSTGYRDGVDAVLALILSALEYDELAPQDKAGRPLERCHGPHPFGGQAAKAQ